MASTTELDRSPALGGAHPRERREQVLVAAELLLAVTAAVGAVGLVTGGVDLGAATDDLPLRSPVLAGIALAVVNGVLPLAVAVGARRRAPWATGGHVAVGVALTGWIVVQVALIGFGSWLQALYGAYGVAVAVLALVHLGAVTAATPSEEGAPDGPDGGPLPFWTPWRVGTLAVAGLFLLGCAGYAYATVTPPGPRSVDVGFARDMTHHHAQALRMATIAVEVTEDEEVRHVASEVLLGQGYQVGFMEATLAAWGHDMGDEHREAMTWMDHPTTLDAMPGLQSEEAIAELSALTGTEFDLRFLAMMGDHHAGGAHMARFAAREAGTERIRALAGQMERHQVAEMGTMDRLAARLAAG